MEIIGPPGFREVNSAPAEYRIFKIAPRCSENISMKLFILSLSLIHCAANADLDQHEQQGLKDTKRMLTTPSERNAAIKNDKNARETDAKVEALTGSGKNKEEIYDIASKVMETITVESKGDPEKMQQLLLEAQSNPQAFYDKYFTAAEKSRVRNLATDIEKKGTKVSKPK